MSAPPLLTADEVRRIAKLARLALGEADIERYRVQLISILGHMAQLQELDVANIEPMMHPSFEDASSNRLEQDEVQPPLPIEALLRNAPAMDGRYLATPKIIGEGPEGG